MHFLNPRVGGPECDVSAKTVKPGISLLPVMKRRRRGEETSSQILEKERRRGEETSSQVLERDYNEEKRPPPRS